MAPPLSQAVSDARARREAAAPGAAARNEWYIDNVVSQITMTLRQRCTLATEWLRNKVVKNISIPVVKEVVDTSAGRRTIVTERSKPGEFPRADTTLLRKTIIGVVHEPITNKQFECYVGTPIDYGVRLELHMDRSFLLRTFNEELPRIRKILTGPIK